MVDKNSLLKMASKLKTKIRIDSQYAQWAKENVPKMLGDEEKKKMNKGIHQNRKKLANIMARINKMSDKKASSKSGGGRAAGVGSALGRTPKSLLKNKLMPNT